MASTSTASCSAKSFTAAVLGGIGNIKGAVLGGLLLVSGRLAHKDIPISFGPFLAGAGLLCLLIGPQAVPGLIPFAFPLGGP